MRLAGRPELQEGQRLAQRARLAQLLAQGQPVLPLGLLARLQRALVRPARRQGLRVAQLPEQVPEQLGQQVLGQGLRQVPGQVRLPGPLARRLAQRARLLGRLQLGPGLPAQPAQRLAARRALRAA